MADNLPESKVGDAVVQDGMLMIFDNDKGICHGIPILDVNKSEIFNGKWILYYNKLFVVVNNRCMTFICANGDIGTAKQLN